MIALFNLSAAIIRNLLISQAALEKSDSGSSTSNPASAEKTLYIPLGTDKPGKHHYDNAHTISKDIPEQFTGDIKIDLDIETVDVFKNDGDTYWHCVQVGDGVETPISIDAPNTGRDYWDNYSINDGVEKFTFILPKDEVPNIFKEIKFASENVIVHGATLSAYDPDEYKTSSNAKMIALTTDLDHANEYNYVQPPYCPKIPKRELESIGGDVKVTLAIKQVAEPKNPEEDRHINGIYECDIAIESSSRVMTKADNVYFQEWDGAYYLGKKNLPDTFTFIIPQSEISKLDDVRGLNIPCRNLLITSAALEKAQ